MHDLKYKSLQSASLNKCANTYNEVILPQQYKKITWHLSKYNDGLENLYFKKSFQWYVYKSKDNDAFKGSTKCLQIQHYIQML